MRKNTYYRYIMSRSSDEEQDNLAQVLTRYQSTKGDADQRKVTSRDNMAKARAAKLKGLAEKREKIVYVSEDEDEKPEPKPKSKGKTPKPSKSDTPDARIKQLEAELATMKKPATLIQQKAKGAEPKYNPCGF